MTGMPLFDYVQELMRDALGMSDVPLFGTKPSVARRIEEQKDRVRREIEAKRDPLVTMNGPGGTPGGTGVLRFPMLRSGLDSLTSGKGAELDITYAGAPSGLRAATPLYDGASKLPGVGLTTRYNTVATAPTVTEYTENPGSDLSKSDPVLGSLTNRARSLGTNFDVSRQLLIAGASGNLAAIVLFISILETAFKTKIETMLWDLIAGDSAIPTLAIGTDGGPITEANICDMVKTVKVGDTPPDALRFIMPPIEETRWTQKARVNTGAGNVIRDGAVLGAWPYATSTRCPTNLSKGTATTICSGLLFGDLADVLVSDHGNGLDLIANPYTKASQGLVSLHGFMHVDVGTIRGASLVKVLDAR